MQCRVMSAIGGSTDFAEQIYLFTFLLCLSILNNVHVLNCSFYSTVLAQQGNLYLL